MGMIGGTDISAIMGENPWKSAHDVYLKCIGELPEIKQNERMEWGLILETPISAKYQNRHQEYMVLPHQVVQHQHLGFLKGSPDRVCKVKNEIVKGLEIKTAGWKDDAWGEDGTDEVPLHYLLQCQWYGGLFNGLDWDLAALFGGSEYHEYSIKFDSELWNAMLESAIKFWRDHVEARKPPEITYTSSSIEWLKKKYPRQKLPLKPANDTDKIAIFNYLTLKERCDIETKKMENAKIQLQALIGDAEGLEWEDGKITYKWQKGCEYTVKKEENRVLRISHNKEK